MSRKKAISGSSASSPKLDGRDARLVSKVTGVGSSLTNTLLCLTSLPKTLYRGGAWLALSLRACLERAVLAENAHSHYIHPRRTATHIAGNAALCAHRRMTANSAKVIVWSLIGNERHMACANELRAATLCGGFVYEVALLRQSTAYRTYKSLCASNQSHHA